MDWRRSSQPQCIHLSDFGDGLRMRSGLEPREQTIDHWRFCVFRGWQTTGCAAKTSSSSSYPHRPGQQQWGLLNLNASRMLAGSFASRAAFQLLKLLNLPSSSAIFHGLNKFLHLSRARAHYAKNFAQNLGRQHD